MTNNSRRGFLKRTLGACWTGAAVRVDGSTPIVMADYAISAPSIGGIVRVDDHGVLEFQLTFGRS